MSPGFRGCLPEAAEPRHPLYGEWLRALASNPEGADPATMMSGTDCHSLEARGLIPCTWELAWAEVSPSARQAPAPNMHRPVSRVTLPVWETGWAWASECGCELQKPPALSSLAISICLALPFLTPSPVSTWTSELSSTISCICGSRRSRRQRGAGGGDPGADVQVLRAGCVGGVSAARTARPCNTRSGTQ